MGYRIGGFLALIFLVLSCTPPPRGLDQETPEYEVYAVEYATLPDMPLSNLLPGADSTVIVDLSRRVSR